MINKSIIFLLLTLFISDSHSGDIEVFAFKTSISNADPELNFILKNNTNKKKRIIFLSDQKYTKYECDIEFGETAIGENSSTIKSFSLVSNDNILELSRYKVDLEAGSLMASYITFNYKNGVTRLPCDIEYSLLDENGKMISKNIYRMERPASMNQQTGAKFRDFKISKSVQLLKERKNMTAVVLLSNQSDKSANIIVEGKYLIGCNATLADEKIRFGMQNGGRIETKGHLPIYTSLNFKEFKKNNQCKLVLKLKNDDDKNDALEITIPMVKNAEYKDHRNKDYKSQGHSMF
ncbi:hypothetical protein [Janthinobacterium lividum]|uniref:hypothetical protein n=1 Tax=Janthinobacterium lividum TaxID=29581 RepID=UPI001595A2E6|nr:hypothetical protein [Janthinobacterium lividum]QKY11956.1 hypothetical protein G8765_29125 [Janthinobacterium lividum]